MTSGLCAREWEKGARSKGRKRLQGLRGVQSFPRSDVTNDAPIANDPDVVWCVCVLVVIKSMVLACRYEL